VSTAGEPVGEPNRFSNSEVPTRREAQNRRGRYGWVRMGGGDEHKVLNYFALKLIEGTEKRVRDRLIADGFLRLTFHRVQRNGTSRRGGEAPITAGEEEAAMCRWMPGRYSPPGQVHQSRYTGCTVWTGNPKLAVHVLPIKRGRGASWLVQMPRWWGLLAFYFFPTPLHFFRIAPACQVHQTLGLANHNAARDGVVPTCMYCCCCTIVATTRYLEW